MKTRLLLFVLCAAILQAGPAQTQPIPKIKDILSALSPTATVPPEWNGIWEATDSIFVCTGEFEEVLTGTDTLCSRAEMPPPPGFGYDCTGTVDATTAHMTCTMQYDPYPNCHASASAEVEGTRIGDTYYFVITNRTTFSGTGVGCGSLPAQCSIIRSHGVRTKPAPPEYCLISTLPTTWGSIKAFYR